MDALKYAWIDSIYTTQWIFYDYSNSTICDTEVIKEYNISLDIFDYAVEYRLPEMGEIFVSRYLWINDYVMFNTSSFGETWIGFAMKNDDVYTVEYAKESTDTKEICGDNRGTTDHIVVVKNSEYIYCSDYSGYDISLPYLFWIFWNENSLEIGNGPVVGQSLITEYDDFSDIESVLIGCDAQDSYWSFYVRQRELILENNTFVPNDILYFTFNYDTVGILQQTANISIISDELSINYVLIIDFEDNTNVIFVTRKLMIMMRNVMIVDMIKEEFM